MGVKLKVRSLWPEAEAEELVYELSEGRVLIGRGRGADVRLPHRAVSLRHATIRPKASGGYAIVDHSSTNGTLVGGKALVPEREKSLKKGDEILLGGFRLVFEHGVPVSPTTAERTASMAKKLARAALGSGEGSAPGPRFVLENGPEEGRVIELPVGPSRLVIGRDEGCEIALNDADISREHAELLVSEEGIRLRDLGSKNGIRIEDKRVESRRLRDGDRLRLGDTFLLFEDPAEAALHALEGAEDLKVEALPEPAEPEPAAPEPTDLSVEENSESGPVGEEASSAESAGEENSEEKEADPSPAAVAATPKKGPAGLDMIIYTLAALVLAASLLGLFWLVRAG